MNRYALVLFGTILVAGLVLFLWPREVETPKQRDEAVEPPAAPTLAELPEARPEPRPAAAMLDREDRRPETLVAKWEGPPESAMPSRKDRRREAPVATSEGTPDSATPDRENRRWEAPVATSAGTPEFAPEATPRSLPPPEGGQDAAPKPEDVGGVVKKDDIRKAIMKIKPGIQACYESALKLDPTLGGSFRVIFEIEAVDDYGKVVSGEIPESELRSPFFEACVLDKIVGARFPAPRGGNRRTKINYPFRFDPDIGWGGR